MDSHGPQEPGQLRSGDDEARRLKAVHRLGLLDTPIEERFGVFTRLAASLCDAPVAAITLVDEDRVWFVSTRGLDPQVREIPRDRATCATVVNHPEGVLVVPDATRDPRFADSPLVTGPLGMRFYAGAPLRGPNGEALGAICVLDTVPRAIDPWVMEALSNLAEGVSSALRVHELGRSAFCDVLTGLGNRRLFEDALEAALAAARRQGTAVGLVSLDLDRFKAVNDQLGHPGGDAVLREAGQRIAAVLAREDLAARLGGDEFSILLPELDPHAALGRVREVADSLLAALRRLPAMVEGQPVPLSASAGAAVLAPRCGIAEDSAAWLVRAADTALYNAKKRGRGRVSVYAPDLDRGIGSKRTLAADLRSCLAAGGGELHLAAQPVRRTADRALIGFEMLLRWDHPALGTISPEDFVPVAERHGLVAQIDAWVIRAACRERAAWPPEAPAIAVNVSPSMLVGGELVPLVRAALAETGLDPARLTLEITERMFLDDPRSAAEASAELQRLGVSVALDDFGSGHASFACLRDIHFQMIKLDRGLTTALEGDEPAAERGRAILSAVIAMAHGIGARVVAEGVETETQFELLRDAGCDAMQGWLMGRPAALQSWWPEPGAV